MNQKVEAMQRGVQQLREADQLCQSIIDAGPAAASTDASQHTQKGWQLARQCNGWANEVQVGLHFASLHFLLRPNCCCVTPVGAWRVSHLLH